MEKVLICISNPLHASRLIRRGATLVRAFDGEGAILWVTSKPYDPRDFNQLQTFSLFETLAQQHQFPLIVECCEETSFKEVVVRIARQKKFTQIVLGNPGQTRLASFFRGALVEELINETGEVDLHVVHVSRQPYIELEDHDRGIPALIEWQDDEAKLTFELPSDKEPDGIFFRSNITEFDHGHFVIKEGSQLKVFQVADRKLIDPTRGGITPQDSAANN